MREDWTEQVCERVPSRTGKLWSRIGMGIKGEASRRVISHDSSIPMSGIGRNDLNHEEGVGKFFQKMILKFFSRGSASSSLGSLSY